MTVMCAVKVYNLCIEENWEYDLSVFPKGIRIAHFPMRDHNPASIE